MLYICFKCFCCLNVKHLLKPFRQIIKYSACHIFIGLVSLKTDTQLNGHDLYVWGMFVLIDRFINLSYSAVLGITLHLSCTQALFACTRTSLLAIESAHGNSASRHVFVETSGSLAPPWFQVFLTPVAGQFIISIKIFPVYFLFISSASCRS